jgi:hypothetical protein
LPFSEPIHAVFSAVPKSTRMLAAIANRSAGLEELPQVVSDEAALDRLQASFGLRRRNRAMSN